MSSSRSPSPKFWSNIRMGRSKSTSKMCACVTRYRGWQWFHMVQINSRFFIYLLELCEIKKDPARFESSYPYGLPDKEFYIMEARIKDDRVKNSGSYKRKKIHPAESGYWHLPMLQSNKESRPSRPMGIEVQWGILNKIKLFDLLFYFLREIYVSLKLFSNRKLIFFIILRSW